MARKPRIWFPGATYHITARGNRRASIFYDNKDFQHYLDLILLCKEQFPFSLHAYCLMPNHIHLLLETKDHSPSIIIKFVHSQYAINFNKRHDLSGHVFQGRYYANLVRTTTYFLESSRYIHLNPLEAEMVEKPEAYNWSSYSAYMDKKKNGPILETERILAYFQEPRRGKYNEYVTGGDGA